MNRGFGFYFGNAIKSSVKTLWHKGNLIKYFAWVIMELLSPFTVILGAMFSLANVRQAKIAERENTVDIPQSFKVACQAKPFWTMLLATVLEALIFLAGAILILIAGALLGAIGYAISGFVDDIEPMLMALIFFAPGGIVLAVYAVIMPILMAPTAYIIETNPDIGAADAISICFNTMKSRGKGTYFVTNLVTALITGAILGLGVAIEFVILLFVSDSDLALVLMVLVGVIFFVAFALVAPMFTLARKIANKSLFEDIVLDPVNASKRTSGVNIKKCKGVKFDPAEYENELALLFDETYSDRIPLPESPSARRKRQLEERKAAKMAASVDYTKTLLEDTAPYTPAPVKPTGDDEDGDLITVSDLIRDVETEPNAEAPAEAPAQEPEAVEPETAEPAAEEKVEAPAEPEPVKEEEPAEEEVKEELAEEPEQEEAAEEPVEEPVKKATKTTATKSTATKSTAAKTTATKSTAAKTTAAKTTAAKSTATKATATKSTAAKSTAAKTTATKSTATKTAAAKPAATKSTTATKSTATKSTTAKPATKTTATKSTTSKSTAKKQ